MTNLRGNAMKFAPRGCRVDVSVRRRGNEAVLTVADDGPGIAEEHHTRLFERFYRVEAERAANGNGAGGTGLGLAISSWIAEAHRGTIRVDSQPGQGATFRVAIPLLAAPAHAEA